MRRIRSASTLACALVSLYASAARATPVDDFRAGTAVYVQMVGAKIDDQEASESGHEIAKAAGSMQIAINRATFGLGDGPPILVTATELDGTTIELSADHTFSPPGSSGDIHVNRVYGTVRARVLSVHGSVSPICSSASCPYSVRLEVMPGGSLHIDGEAWKDIVLGYGEWFSFSKDASDLRGLGLAGLPRPSLLSFDVTAPEVECRSDALLATRTYSGRVKLGSPAPFEGAWVDVESSDPTLLPPRRVFVPQGGDTATFPLRFSATDGGLYAIRASSGGASATRTLNVRACLTDVRRIRPYVENNSALRDFCRPCLDGARLTDRSFGVVWWPEGWQAFSPDRPPAPLDPLVGGQVFDAAVGPFGDIAGGFVSPNGEALSFRLTRWADQPRVDVFPYGGSPFVSPTGGAFFVRYGDQQQGSIVGYDDQRSYELPVPGSPYEVAGMTGGGELVVNSYLDGFARAFVIGFDGPIEVRGPGENLRVLAVSASGAMLGASSDMQGMTRPVLLPNRFDGPIDLPPLPYAPWSYPVGMDDDGVVLVNGWTENQEPVPYLVAPGEEPVELSALIEGLDMRLLEATAISPGGLVTARAVRDGQTQIVVLAPRNDP